MNKLKQIRTKNKLLIFIVFCIVSIFFLYLSSNNSLTNSKQNNSITVNDLNLKSELPSTSFRTVIKKISAGQIVIEYIDSTYQVNIDSKLLGNITEGSSVVLNVQSENGIFTATRIKPIRPFSSVTK